MMLPPSVDLTRLLRLRLVVARHGEMDAARWWNSRGMLGRHGALVLTRGFPRTHYFAQARVVFAVVRSRCDERPGDFCPLVLDAHGHLYLYRYWQYEQQLADDLRRRAAHTPPEVDAGRLHDRLARLFPPRRSPDCDWQKIATAVAALKHFCVIAGGPGTGKTSTVARVLALLVEQAGAQQPRIGLAAPTGKATARLQEAVRHAEHQLSVDTATRDAIPDQASTLQPSAGRTP